MKIVTVFFPGIDKNNIYEKQLTAFLNSAKQNLKSLEIEVVRMPSPEQKRESYLMDSNHVKLKKWYECLLDTTEDIIFMDCDMLIYRDFGSEDFANVKNFALCKNETRKYPFNGGFIVAKNNEVTREIFRRWVEIDAKMYSDPLFHAPYRDRYAGMNQAAFGYLIENGIIGTDDITYLSETFNFTHGNKYMKRFYHYGYHVMHCKGFFRNWIKKRTTPTTFSQKRALQEWWVFYKGKSI